MPRYFLPIIAITALVLSSRSASVNGPVPGWRAIYERGGDPMGTDLAQIFDTTVPACAAFTFNDRSNACFPKRDITRVIPYDGAVSGRVIVAMLHEAIGKYGFRVVDTQMESDSASPRICAVFSEDR